ncbi:MAG: hypothetical protein IJS13_10300 [Paludibacteraceae bacterium]|nr:hypothetical protein [Paludibacteraceae bacterium]
MSVLFPKVNKAPEWHWRPIYYDPKKDEMDRKLRELQQRRAAEEEHSAKSNSSDEAVLSEDKMPSRPYTPTLHRGSFRESHEENMSPMQRASRQSKAAFWIALLLMLAFLYWLL